MTVFVVKAVKMGTVAFFRVIFPSCYQRSDRDRCRVRVAKTGNCGGGDQALFPKTAFTAAEAKTTTVSVTARISVTFRLKADPAGPLSGEPCLSVRNVKIAP